MSSSRLVQRGGLVAAAIVLSAIVAAANESGPTRAACAPRLTARIRPAAVVVNAVDASINVRVADADASLPSVAGSQESDRDSSRFQPAYPFLLGQRYRVQASSAACQLALDTTFVLPKPDSPRATQVVAVYPTSTVLPMNQLKMYVQFSSPMRAGEAAAHARLVDDATGRAVPDAFYSLEDELWDPSQTRLTLLFDPGRIKRGLRPNEELGLPLRAGRRYRLVIDRSWLGANGDSLTAGFEKRFDVVAPDRTAPRVAEWGISAPRAGTLDTLSIKFLEPLDHALLERALVVHDSDGRPVVGKSDIGRNETSWRFVPTSAWTAGRYTLLVDTDLEDLAGNNLRRLFDTDLTDRSAPTLERGRTASVTINIR